MFEKKKAWRLHVTTCEIYLFMATYLVTFTKYCSMWNTTNFKSFGGIYTQFGYCETLGSLMKAYKES